MTETPLIGSPEASVLLLAGAILLAGLTWLGVRWIRGWLIAQGIHDTPNHRSSHTEIKPRGAGLVVTPLAVIAVGLTGWLTGASPLLYLVAALTLALGMLSFWDDRRGLPAIVRFGAQVLAVGVVMTIFDGGTVFQGWLPLWLDRLITALAWLWFINLFNFMDGIDGITGVETAVIAFGLMLTGLLAGLPEAAWLPPICLGAVALGFLVWNWPPSRIFLGDSGSIGLGVLLGWFLIEAAAQGQWAVALILPGYYWADATVTLLRRLFRGAKIWHPHREHFYQRAVQAGWPHGKVSSTVALTGAGLIAIAGAATAMSQPWIGLIAAAMLVVGAIAILSRARAS